MFGSHWAQDCPASSKNAGYAGQVGQAHAALVHPSKALCSTAGGALASEQG